MAVLEDRFGRNFPYLRLSIIEACNFRCSYCLPDGFHARPDRPQPLSREEIARLLRGFADVGLSKLRLTGGEPSLRRDLPEIIASAAAVGGIDSIALTTNGTLLAAKARSLKDAGLTRLTVSLDALSSDVFRQMSDSGVAVGRVLDGIAAAQAVGLAPVKVNTVVKRGVNEGEILPLVRHFRHSGVILRFIEFMDVGTTNGWRLDDVVTAQEMLERIDRAHPLRPVDPNYVGEVAKRWAFVDGGGEIGVIASVTQAFCHECTRLRLSTDGRLYTCLFANEGYDLRSPLRGGEEDCMLRERVVALWSRRGDRYSQLRHDATALPVKKIEMSYIGG